MNQLASIYLAKAEESLAGAESEFAMGRYNNCANRCYYACFQAAIHALLLAGARPPGGAEAEWSHVFVQAQFAGELIRRRKIYPANLRDTLTRALVLRQIGDYRGELVGQTQMERGLHRARDFIANIQMRGGERR